jgi:DNA (cytosine-5)-methyltransferase 1
MDLGAERAGVRVRFANDSMTLAAKSHAVYFPDTKFVHAPVEDVTEFPSADLVVGGYPCQSFSMGGVRDPERDKRTQLYRDFARCLDAVSPSFFVAENVSGLRALKNGRFLEDQIELFSEAGQEGGYNLAVKVLHATEYGVPQRRKRLFIVGVRKDLGSHYWFPAPTHAKPPIAERKGLKPLESHGDAIANLPLWPDGEFYERPHDPEGHFSWYYMSRNRKAPWRGPSFTIVANWRHTTLHPASPIMTLTWSNLADGWKQRWDFQDEYEHAEGHPERPVLDVARRLSWRECAAIQTFPSDFEPAGDTEKKIEQIGNAVPPVLAEAVIRPLVERSGLRDVPSPDAAGGGPQEPRQLVFV